MFKYKTVRKGAKFTGGFKPKLSNDPEVLLGTLQGKSVPQDEERFYRAVAKSGKARSYQVQYQIGQRGLPGYRTVDALVGTDFGYRAFEIDGMGFVHLGKQASDKLADIQRVQGLLHQGIYLRYGIEHVADTWLLDQKHADLKVKELRL